MARVPDIHDPVHRGRRELAAACVEADVVETWAVRVQNPGIGRRPLPHLDLAGEVGGHDLMSGRAERDRTDGMLSGERPQHLAGVRASHLNRKVIIDHHRETRPV